MRVELVDTNRRITLSGLSPCITQYHSIADSLDAAGVSWKYHAAVGVVRG